MLPLKLIIRAHSRADTGRAVNGVKSAGNGIPVKRKLLNNNHLNARGGLEPDFRVLVSTLFHPIAQVNCHQGGNQWNPAEAKVWRIVASLLTFSALVTAIEKLRIVPPVARYLLSTDCENIEQNLRSMRSFLLAMTL